MVFGSRSKIKKAKNAKLSIGNVQIQQVTSFKYLGFTLDPVLSLSNHTSSLLNVISDKAYILSKIRRFITEYSAIRIYKAMLLPYFDYADIVYDRARQKDLDKLQRLKINVSKYVHYPILKQILTLYIITQKFLSLNLGGKFT